MAQNGLISLDCAPQMIHDPFWRNTFLTGFRPIFGPETAHFQGILGFLEGQQASPQLHSVLAIALSQRFGSFANLAILEPRWCPCQIQVLSQKLNSGAPGQWRQVGRCPPKLARFVLQNSLFWPKTALETHSTRPNEGKRLLRFTYGLTSP